MALLLLVVVVVVVVVCVCVCVCVCENIYRPANHSSVCGIIPHFGPQFRLSVPGLY